MSFNDYLRKYIFKDREFYNPPYPPSLCSPLAFNCTFMCFLDNETLNKTLNSSFKEIVKDLTKEIFYVEI